MKRMFVLMILLNLLFVLVSCNSLNNVDTSVFETENITNSEENESLVGDFENDSTVADDRVTEEISIPEPIVAQWGGKTVTMEYVCVTDILFDSYFGCTDYKNGYAVFNDIGDIDSPIDVSEFSGVNWNFIDYTGNRLFEYGFEEVTDFDEKGVAAAKKHDGTYVFLNIDGSETGVATKAEYNDFKDKFQPWLYPPVARYHGSSTAYEDHKIVMSGNLYNGLIPILKCIDEWCYDVCLGLVDINGNIVIEPTYDIEYPRNSSIYLTEGHIVVGYKKRLAIIKVTIAGEDNQVEALYPDEVALPEPIVTQWDDKTITIEYEAVTNILQLSSYNLAYYVNGYARFWEFGDVDDPVDGRGNWIQHAL